MVTRAVNLTDPHNPKFHYFDGKRGPRQHIVQGQAQPPAGVDQGRLAPSQSRLPDLAGNPTTAGKSGHRHSAKAASGSLDQPVSGIRHLSYALSYVGLADLKPELLKAGPVMGNRSFEHGTKAP